MAAGLMLLPHAVLAGDRQIRPFAGATFNAGTTFVSPAGGSIGKNLILGASGVFISEIFGIEADVADVPGFFESDASPLVIDSRVTTETGSFKFRLSPEPGKYRVSVKPDGAEPVTKDVEIDGAAVYRIALNLPEKPKP